jgi:hypothetical protein
LNKGILFGENPCVTLDVIQNEAGNHIPVGFGIPWMDSQRKSASLHIEQYCTSALIAPTQPLASIRSSIL